MRTVLVIDDHIPTLTTLCMILKANGYKTLNASDAEHAKRQFRDCPVDMVLVDHGLPGITGTELARDLKAVRNVLVIMLSGNPELRDKPDEVDLLLPKPQLVPELLAAMEKLFAAA